MSSFKKGACLAGLFLFGILSVGYATSFSSADEHIVWRRTPIEINLPVGLERFVTFPSEVRFGYNKSLLPSSILRVENDNQTLYLLARKPFATQRTEARLSSGELILLDISAKNENNKKNKKPNANDNPIDIVLPKVGEHKQANDPGEGSNDDFNSNIASVNYVSLMRYAIQQLYAPERLLKASLLITRFPMETTHIAPLFYDDSATAMPLASWRGGDLYVTALLIKNLLNQSLRLDPRVLCGNWVAASFYPQVTLSPKGTAMNRDTSTLFVISKQPFSEAMHACLPEA